VCMCDVCWCVCWCVFVSCVFAVHVCGCHDERERDRDRGIGECVC